MKFSRKAACIKKCMYVDDNIETASHLARIIQQSYFLVHVGGPICVIT